MRGVLDADPLHASVDIDHDFAHNITTLEQLSFLQCIGDSLGKGLAFVALIVVRAPVDLQRASAGVRGVFSAYGQRSDQETVQAKAAMRGR